MTARLESQMDRITEGELRSERSGRREPGDARAGLEGCSRRTSKPIRDRIKGAVREGMTLGVVHQLRRPARMLRGKTGKRFVACVGKEGDEAKVPEGAPEGKRPRRGCGQTFPLPQRGVIIATGTTCTECGWPEIKVLGAGGRGRPWQLCLDIDCPTKEK